MWDQRHGILFCVLLMFNIFINLEQQQQQKKAVAFYPILTNWIWYSWGDCNELSVLMSQVRRDSTNAEEICNRNMKIGMNGVRMEMCAKALEEAVEQRLKGESFVNHHRVQYLWFHSNEKEEQTDLKSSSG